MATNGERAAAARAAGVSARTIAGAHERLIGHIEDLSATQGEVFPYAGNSAGDQTADAIYTVRRNTERSVALLIQVASAFDDLANALES